MAHFVHVLDALQAKISGAANKVALRALAADIAKANGSLLASQVNELAKLYDAKLKDATVEVCVCVSVSVCLCVCVSVCL
jgi:hypothetical protein